MTDWLDQLQPASWRGVPFGVLSEDGRFGRRTAVHEYPFRDKPWVEDLGRAGRRIGLTGFLIQDSLVYGGGDVTDQRDRMVAAAEAEGPGTLVHPTLGQLTVSMNEPLAVVARFDQTRYFELTFTFVESGERVFPTSDVDTGAAVADAADALDVASSSDFVATASPILKLVPGGGRILAEAGALAGSATSFGADAGSLSSLVSQLPGNFGRYAAGANAGGLGGGALVRPGATVDSLIALGSAVRREITASAGGVTAAAARLSGDPASLVRLAGAAQSLVGQVRAAAADPADALRMVGQLAGFGF